MDALNSSIPTDDVADEQPRAASRSHALLAAEVVVEGETCPVHLRNVSRTGALIEPRRRLEVDSRLILKRSDLSIKAKVVRTEAGKLALTFDRALDEEEFLTLSRRIRPEILQPLYR